MMIILRSYLKRICIPTVMLLTVFFAVSEDHAYAAGLEIPEIIPRSFWGAGASTPGWPIEHADVEKFVIHHTASSTLTPDPDGSGRYTNMVESIYNYHSDKKTWYDDDGEYVGFGDIGYNYIIDPNGNIYEGRAGGNGSIAGHVRGFNVGSVGISVIGRYQDYTNSKNEKVSSHPVTSAISGSLEKLIGWLSSANSTDINQTSSFHGMNIDGVVGHRDLSATICPGNDLYSKLPQIQKEAANNKTEYDKYAYQIPGDQSIYVLDGGYKLKFNTASELPSGYKNKNIIPASESQIGLFRYKNSKIYPDGSLLKEFNASAIYFIENQGKRHLNMTGEEFLKMGFNSNNVISVFKNDLNLYKDGTSVLYAKDGQLLKDASSNVYFTENGKKRRFTSANLFEYLGYKWKNIKSDTNIGLYLNGQDMLYPDKTLLRATNDFNVYYIENKQKRKVTSDILMKKLGFNSKNVIVIESSELAHFPSAKNMTYPDGTLVQAHDSSSVYVVENGNVRIFPSAELFLKLGHKWKDILKISHEELKEYPLQGKVLQPDGSLVKFSDSPDVYLVKEGKLKTISSIEMFNKHGFDWKNVLMLPYGDKKEYPTGSNLKLPAGTIVKSAGSNEVFVVDKNEKLKEFTSTTLFNIYGNKWTDITVLDKADFAAYDYNGIVTYPEKTLIKSKNKDSVYVIKAGVAIGIKSLSDFNKAGYKWKNVIEISNEELQYQIDPDSAFQKRKMLFSVSASQPKNELKAGNTSNIAESKKNESGNASSTIPSSNPSEQPASATISEPEIRIAIHSITGGNIQITSNGKYSVNRFNSDGSLKNKDQKNAGDISQIDFFNDSSYIRLIPADNNTIFELLSYNDLSWNKEINDNRFKGNIELKYSDVSDKLWIINELSLEDYVNGIAEASSDSPDEYLKAFSVIARTYAMYYIKRGGKHTGEPFHLKNSRNGNGNDQSYKGYNFEIRAGKITAMNKITAGEIITFNGDPIVAAYSSDSGGVTKNACDVLSKNYCSIDYSYLEGGITDPDGTVHDETKISLSHGAGMSAVGAVKMAQNGNLWKNIILYYYPGVKTDKYY